MKKRLQLVALSVLTGAALVNVNASAASTENYPNALLIQAEDDDQAGDDITSGDQDEVTLPLDMTSYIVNPYMDSKDGWLSTCSAQNKALTSNKQGDFTGQFYEHWNSSAFDGKFYQIIEDLPVGVYELKAAVFGILSNANATGEGLYLYANNNKTQVTSVEPVFYTVENIVIAGDPLEIGWIAEMKTNNWIGSDNYSLTKVKDYDYDLFFIELGRIVSMVPEGNMLADVQTALSNSKEVALAISELDTEEDVINALLTIKRCVKEAELSIANYEKLAEQLVKTKAVYDEAVQTEEEEPADVLGADILKAALDKAQAMYDEGSVDNVDATIAELKLAVLDFKVISASPENEVDLTFTLVNPDATDGNNGWNITGHMNNPATSQYWTTDALPYFDGGNWNGTGWEAAIDQDLELPAGRYMLTAYGRASSGTTTELFAEINTSAYSCVGDVGGEVWEMAEDDTPEKLCNGGKGRGWSIRSVELYVPEVGTVKFGVKSQTAGYQQWFSAGAFTLKAIGANENEGYDALYKSLKSANGIYDASFKNADILAEAIDQAGSLLGFTADSDEMIAMATELDKVADAYLFANASAELPYNMTSYMVNPNAADKTNGWSLKGSAGASIGILSNQYFTGATVPYFDGGNWGATGWNVDFYQNVSVLPSGKYIIKAAGRGNTSVDLSIYASSYLGELQANSELFNVCGDVGGEIWAEAAEGSAEKLCNGGNGRGWGYRTVEFPYLNGTDITIGFEASTEAHQQWMSAADFELFYIGKISTQEGQTAISSMLAAADKINSDKLFGDILINFTNAKASAEAALESDDIYQLESACKELNDAILEAQNMAEQFVVLKEQLDIAATYAETTYAGKEAFDAAVAKAQDIYDNLSADPQVAAAELAAAIKAYRLTQVGSADEPADYTFMIVNNGFETGDLTGWTTSSEGDTGVKSNTTAPYTCEGGDGSYLFNTWNNGVGYEISQEIEGLPVGFYSLTVAFASDANVNGTLCLNDAVVDTESSPTGASLFVDHTTPVVEIPDGKAVIKANSPSWYKVDNFRLSYHGTEDIGSAINSVGAGSKVIITVAGGVDIISDEACVMPVYALNGALIKVVEVEAGTQFVSLNAGTYVINRTVVIVK